MAVIAQMMRRRRGALLSAIDQEYAAKIAAAMLTERGAGLAAVIDALERERAAKTGALLRDLKGEPGEGRRRLAARRRRAGRRARRKPESLSMLTPH